MSAANKRQKTLFSFFALPARADHSAPCTSHSKREPQQASRSDNAAAGDDDMVAHSPAACSPLGHVANPSAVTSQTFVSSQLSHDDLAADDENTLERNESCVPDKRIPAALPSEDPQDLAVDSPSEGLVCNSADKTVDGKPSCLHEATNAYEQQVSESALFALACYAVLLAVLLQLPNTVNDKLSCSGQRQERIQRNHERMRSLGLHQIARASFSAAAPCPSKSTKPKAKTKAKAAIPQRSYSLRARAGSASAVPDQAQPLDSQVSL